MESTSSQDRTRVVFSQTWNWSGRLERNSSGAPTNVIVRSRADGCWCWKRRAVRLNALKKACGAAIHSRAWRSSSIRSSMFLPTRADQAWSFPMYSQGARVAQSPWMKRSP